MIKYSEDAVKRAVQRTAEEARKATAAVCPVRTGRLKSSISLTCEGREGKVFSDVEYAAAVELGTQRQRSQPYLSKGLREAAKKAAAIFREELL